MDAKTFVGLYETVYRDLYRFALYTMKHPQDAEDAVSEAVIAAYENIGKLKKDEAFKSWIFTILIRICKRRLKQQGTETFFELEEDTLKNEQDLSLAVDVKKAFAVLTEEERLIVALSVFGGYNSKEIGQMLGEKKISDGTIRSKRSRALEKMRIVLE